MSGEAAHRPLASKTTSYLWVSDGTTDEETNYGCTNNQFGQTRAQSSQAVRPAIPAKQFEQAATYGRNRWSG